MMGKAEAGSAGSGRGGPAATVSAGGSVSRVDPVCTSPPPRLLPASRRCQDRERGGRNKTRLTRPQVAAWNGLVALLCEVAPSLISWWEVGGISSPPPPPAHTSFLPTLNERGGGGRGRQPWTCIGGTGGGSSSSFPGVGGPPEPTARDTRRKNGTPATRGGMPRHGGVAGVTRRGWHALPRPPTFMRAHAPFRGQTTTRDGRRGPRPEEEGGKKGRTTEWGAERGRCIGPTPAINRP